MKNKILITNDAFGIVDRVKSINKNYVIYYNTKLKKYEVHNKKYLKNTFEFSLPCCKLDSKTIVHIIKLLKYNNINVIKDMEKQNKEIEDKNKEMLLEQTKQKFSEIYKYSSVGTKEFDSQNAYTNVWI